MLYKKAIDVLIALQKTTPPSSLNYYSDEILIEEAQRLTKYYLPVLNGEEISKKLCQEYVQIWHDLLPLTHKLGDSFVLRDYHSENIMYLENNSSTQKIGILDFQDALIGSPVYDIVSLLEDARIDVAQNIVDQMINYYLSNHPNINRKDFLAAYAILGVQRNSKILGIFANKAFQDKDTRYLQYIPRIKKYIYNALKHPLLSPLQSWFDRVMPR